MNLSLNISRIICISSFCLVRTNHTVVQKRTPKKSEKKKNRKTKTKTPMCRAKQTPMKMATRKPLLKLPPKTKIFFAFFAMDPQNSHATKIGYNVQNVSCGLT